VLKTISMENKNLITNEIAIKSIKEDLLNYHPFANKAQKIIQGYSNNPEPLTIGIYGKWGSGKSSLLNLIERNIEVFHKEKDDKPYIKFHYNPWLYQTKDEMLFDFFDTLSRKLNYIQNDNLKKAGKLIKKYSRYLKSVKLSASGGIPKLFNAGVTIEPYEILQKIGEDLEGEEKSLNELKDDIDNTLSNSDKKIIIFIDDVDRLDKDEIFTLFKLIKINADFKNLIFIVCLDPDYVSKAIHQRYGNDIHSGQEFLDKIINIPIELPLIEEADLDYFVKEKLKPVLSAKNLKKVDFDELISSVKGEYFNSPREVIRIVNSFSISYFAIGDEVNAHDLFWIEFMKIKYPISYKLIKKYAGSFKSNLIFADIIDFNDTISNSNSESGLRKDLLENHKESYRIINFLFPMDRKGIISANMGPEIKPKNVLDAELRINHVSHFEKYFSFHIKGKISELSFSSFKAKIITNDSEGALKLLNEMIKNIGERKMTYRIISEIEIINEENTKELINFLVDNINLFQEVTNVNSHSVEILIQIVERLSSNLDSHTELISSIANRISHLELCYFIGALQNSGIKEPFLEKLFTKLISKVIELDKNEQPFFKNRNISKMIMRIWAKLDLKVFSEYLIEHLNSRDNIYSFITSFPTIWNESINGVFKEVDYKFLTETLGLNSKFIYDILKNNISEIKSITFKDIDNKWDDQSNNTPLKNIEQFVYWHLLKEKQDDIDNTD